MTSMISYQGLVRTFPKLPDHVEQILKTVDVLIPREIREYQKTLKQFEDVVNKPLSDLRK